MSELTEEKDILLAEDDKEDVDIFDFALKELNFPYLLRNAEDGEQLFTLLKEKLPYILFLDIHMPCKDGVACIAEIRKNREYDSLPVIMYTSLTTEKYVEDSFRNGANMYVTKSHSFRELVAKLQKVFSINWTEYLHYPPRNQFMLS
ncbi:MAG: response regulator [Flavipsychrobacter sp.]